MNYIGTYTMVRRGITRVFRVSGQTLMAPWISAALFIFVFGEVVGSRIDTIAGTEYILFVFPGILMMNVIISSFAETSSIIFFMRFQKSIEEILTAPLSHAEMLIGLVATAVARTVVVASGILLIGTIFGAVQLQSFPLFLFYTIVVATLFALIGILIGLWAQSFEQLRMLDTYALTPLSFLGGMFYSIDMLPTWAQYISSINPLFYMIDGMRFAMLGIHESNILLGMLVIAACVVIFTFILLHIFKIGWRLRE